MIDIFSLWALIHEKDFPHSIYRQVVAGMFFDSIYFVSTFASVSVVNIICTRYLLDTISLATDYEDKENSCSKTRLATEQAHRNLNCC